ncbi:MAG: hypothetical protein AAF704_00640 [Cyanobacteria bacterium P01_D01_bin.123]
MSNIETLAQLMRYILRLATLALVLSVAVKYGGGYLHLPATPAVALAMLILPAAILTSILGWQTWRDRQSNRSRTR